MKISSNGLISFGNYFIEYFPEMFPISAQVIAPYWDDIDLSDGGNILYDSFNAMNGSGVLRNISNFINSAYYEPKSFEASSALVVYWKDTCPHIYTTCLEVSSYIIRLDAFQF